MKGTTVRRLLLCAAITFVWTAADAQRNVIAESSELEQTGRFKEAGALLERALSETGRTAKDKKELEFELDRLKRIRLDYSMTEDALFSSLQKSVKAVTLDEFHRWIAEGRFDRRTIDGQVWYVGVSRSNLFWRYPDAAARRINPPDAASFERAVWQNCVAIKNTARETNQSYVNPKRFKVVMTVTAKPGAAPEGETIRAWLPIPRKFPFQSKFQLVGSVPALKNVGDEASTIRSAYFEQQAVKGRPTEFRIEYTYEHQGIYFDLQPEQIKPYQPSSNVVRDFTKAGPHVVFSDKIKELSKDLVGGETNPLIQAHKIYNWLTGNVKYSFALEYSTIRNIGGYCLDKMYGDCGQEALLFITLCRFNGIPARWQSGWFTFPGGKTIHDWTEVYFEPYGWVPVDPYMGIFAMRYLKSLDEKQKLEVRDFYFGGLDQYRMSANSDHNQDLDPPKHSMRSDNVDFQRGEMEYGERNIYFDLYSYELSTEEVGR